MSACLYLLGYSTILKRMVLFLYNRKVILKNRKNVLSNILSRCAVCFKPFGNVLTDNIIDLWENSEELKEFRSKEYLNDTCKKCDILDKCGGGCAISCGTVKLETDQLVKKLKL